MPGSETPEKTTATIYIKISQQYILNQENEEFKDLLGRYFQFALHTGQLEDT